MLAGRISVLHIGCLPLADTRGGGMAILCQSLLLGLAERDFDVSTISPTILGDSSLSRFAERHPSIAVYPYTMPQVAHDLSSRETLLTQQRLAAEVLRPLLDERPIDIVVVGHPAWAMGVPRLVRIHGMPSIVWVHSPMVDVVVDVPRYPRALLPQILENMRGVDSVVSVAEHVTSHLRGLGLENVTTIASGVDSTHFRARAETTSLRRTLDIDDDAVVALHLSNLKPAKRAELLIESAASALERHAKLVYVIVGDGPKRSDMMAACDAHGITSRVRFTGWVEHSKVPDYLNIADLVVMPSVSEGLALAYLETQACGKTLLASDIPAAREVINDGRTGVLFPVDNVDALTARTLALATDSHQRRRIGRLAREWVIHRHDRSHMLDAYALHIMSLAAVGRNRHNTHVG